MCMFLRRRKSRGEASYFRRLCAKFVLKICTMDRILQNQWNVQNHLKPLFAKKKRGNIREIKPLTLLDFSIFKGVGRVRVPVGSPLRTVDRTFKVSFRLFPPAAPRFKSLSST